MAINIPNLKLRRTYFTINAPATGIIKDKCVRGAKNKKHNLFSDFPLIIYRPQRKSEPLQILAVAHNISQKSV